MLKNKYLFIGILLWLYSPNSFSLIAPLSQQEQRYVASAIQGLEANHFSKAKFDLKKAKEFLSVYFKILDSRKKYFRQSDIDEFSSKLDLLQGVKKGSLKLPRAIFNKYIQLRSERTKWVKKKFLNQKFDFEKDESFRFNHRWAKSQAELDEYWRKILKVDLLQYELDFQKNPSYFSRFGQDPNLHEVAATAFVDSFLRYRQADTDDLILVTMVALTKVFDSSTSYVGWRQHEYLDPSADLFGIGVFIRGINQNQEFIVTRVIQGGSAFKDGRLKVGDRIVAIGEDGTDLVNAAGKKLLWANRNLQGPLGSRVKLKVFQGSNNETLYLELERTRIDRPKHPPILLLPSGGNLGILKISNEMMNEKLVPFAKSEIQHFIDKYQIKGLILDLRFCRGGYLANATGLADLFIPSGPLAQLKSKDGVISKKKSTDQGFFFDLPLIVLTTRYSISAAEIFASIIQDYRRGVIVGETQTFGKGVSQSLFMSSIDEKRKTGIWITLEKIYGPLGNGIQIKGVKSDIIVPTLLDHNSHHLLKDFIHALTADSISPLRIDRAIDIGPFLPEILSRSKKRFQTKRYQTWVSEATAFKEFRTTALPLKRSKWDLYKKKGQLWSKLFSSRYPIYEHDLTNDNALNWYLRSWEYSYKHDRHLFESIKVLDDLVQLSAK